MSGLLPSLYLQAGTYNNQYSIVYQRETLGVSSLENVSSVYVRFDKNNKTVQLLGVENLNDVKGIYIYAMDGKQVLSYSNLDSKVFDVSYFNDGVYILKLEMRSGSVENIRFIKY